MRIKLDRTVCDGFGVCALRAPELVTLDEWGYAALVDRTGTVPAEQEQQVTSAISGCPVHAITRLDGAPQARGTAAG
jgi:ferredoxin